MITTKIKKIEATEDMILHNVTVTKGTKGELITETEEFKNNIGRTLKTVIFAIRRNQGFYYDKLQIHLTPEIADKIKVVE